jgi:hypothetical protein
MRAALSVIFLCCATVDAGALCKRVTVEEAFAASRVVFIGRAIAQEVDAPADRRPWYTVTTFEVEEMWKGSPDTTVRVRTCGALRRDLGLGYSCDPSFMFQVGARYLVFATREPLETDECLPTGLIEGSQRSQAALQWLASKPRITGR